MAPDKAEGSPAGGRCAAEVSALRPSAPTRDRRLLSLGLFVVLAFVYWACVRRYLPYDGDIMVRVTKSLVTQHSFRIEDPVLHLNEPYAFYGLAVSLLLVPLFAAGQWLFSDGTILLTSFEPMVTALTVIALLHLLVDLGISWRGALTVALIYALGSLAWAYSGVLYSEPLVGLCITSGLLFLKKYEREGRSVWLGWAGGASALALLARWDSALLVVVPLAAYAGYIIWRETRWWRLAAFATPVALATTINLAYDLFRYGRPLASPYLGTFRFSTPLPVGIFGLLLSPGAGLVVYVPVLVLGGFGATALFRRWPRVALVIAGTVAVRFLLYGQWYGWDGGITFGPRFLVPILPVLFVPLAFVPRTRVMTAITVLLSSLSVGVELLNQVVPYGQYYTAVAGALDAWARQQCSGCALWHVVQLTTARLDYDSQYIPLHGQLAMLLQGRIDPIWSRIAPALLFVVPALGFVVYRLYRLAGRLDAAAPSLGMGRREPLQGARSPAA
jgi:hypothetical protein